MALDLIPRRMLTFSNSALPNFWDEEDQWLSNPIGQNGISISEDEAKIYISAAVPGIDPKNVEATFQDGYLWIRGETKDEEEDKKRKYYRKASQSFSYRVAVPGDIDETKEPEATYKHGVMTVSFSKSPKTQPRKIQIKKSGE
jgi:HSP20 family protein